MKTLKKIIKYIKNPKAFKEILIIKLGMKGIIKFNDKTYLKALYKLAKNKELNLENPETFNEKIQWLKLYNRNSMYTQMVDKYEVKKYVGNIIGNEYIIPTIGIYNKFKDIDFQKLPDRFVIKPTHYGGSEGVFIIKDKSKINIVDMETKINELLKKNLYYYAREWPYKNVEPRIIIEKYMEDESKDELKDYKIFCFNGKAKIIQVDYNRFKGHKRKLFDTDWNLLKVEYNYPMDETIIEKPKNLKTMLEMAEKISNEIPFCRTDFYSIDDNIFFGEITFYPGAGFEEFKPEEWDKKLGDLLELPTKREGKRIEK